MSVKNAQILPKVYFGMHMEPGVAEYREPEGTYRIFIGEETIKNMDPSFQGRPVYVRHVDEVSIENIQNEADGYVVESFFNKTDGKHWCKFIVVSDKGHEAIRSGWKLSNAYIPKQTSTGGLWHGVEYQKEVTQGEYEHLAIVPNPRYESSIILTPEAFKKYNSEKEVELKRLANSKEEKVSMFSFFKKSKVENSADLEGTSVLLPRSKKEFTLTEIINEMDTYHADLMANGEHSVMVGEEKMKVNDLIAKYCDMKKNMEAAPKVEEVKENEEEKKPEEEKKENEEEKPKAEEKKENHFEALKNAPSSVQIENIKIDLSRDRVSRGKSRYGSK